MENCDERNHGQKNTQKNEKKGKESRKKPKKKTLKRNPEAKCMVCTWLNKKNSDIFQLLWGKVSQKVGKFQLFKGDSPSRSRFGH